MFYRNVKDIIINPEDYLAHTRKGEVGQEETLPEHTLLCQKYFEMLLQKKKLLPVIEHFKQMYFGEMSETALELFDDMFYNVPTFHDIGKSNPKFQRDRMHNKKIKDSNDYEALRTTHSMLSSAYYFQFYMDKVRRLAIKQEKTALKNIVFYHSYMIAKHHGGLDKFLEYAKSLRKGGGNGEGPGCCAWEIAQRILADTNVTADGPEFDEKESICSTFCKRINDEPKEEEREKYLFLYTYLRLLYSLLTASDYYATAEYGYQIEITDFGNMDDINEFYKAYQNTAVMHDIRRYEAEKYLDCQKQLESEKNINILRSELFLDAEKELCKNIAHSIFYLEAPTGSGKSNTAFNLSFRLLQEDRRLHKIYYVYPFNTLVEQNRKNLMKVFENQEELSRQIAVINSITPMMKKDDSNSEELSDNETNRTELKEYAKALLDRQFLNYPVIVTTHVSLFGTMFGKRKEEVLSFYQLANSVIVLDEIQSYKNKIWTEIISFLHAFSEILNLKVIIMSATLPDLEYLRRQEAGNIDFKSKTAKLIQDREKYFSNPLFRDRVRISLELLWQNKDREEKILLLLEHVLMKSKECIKGGKRKTIVVEFIKKATAYEFYDRILEMEPGCPVGRFTGDDNIADRSRILEHISACKENGGGLILVATQVVEAGVDIDMDVGYKNISLLDSEEQFLGRINRSCNGEGEAFFFKLDDTKSIYKEDIRENRCFSLLDEEMQKILINKNFVDYYKRIMEQLKVDFNESESERGMNKFYEHLKCLDFDEICGRMKLIDTDDWTMSIFLARKVILENGTCLNGEEIWAEYAALLQNQKMDYSEKRVKMSVVTSNMNYFIYQLQKKSDISYQDRIGELYYIEDGEQFFENGILNKKKLETELALFAY